MKIDNLVRPNIAQLKPYRSARQDHIGGILLDANENAFGSPVAFDDIDLNRYPDPYQSALRERLSETNGVAVNSLFIGAGSDEIIDLLFRVFCEPGYDNVIIPEPTYGMYRVSADIHNVPVRSCLLSDDFQIDLPEITSRIDKQTKMIFCCSPNNPTGNVLKKNDILNMCSVTNSIIVVDEAYVEFSDAVSLIESVKDYPNLVVLRTFSKAWGMAGLRLGYCVADPTVIKFLLKVKAPYNVNSVSAAMAMSALNKVKERDTIITSIRRERKRILSYLHSIQYVRRIFPTDANFILVQVEDADLVYSKLLEKGIVIRNRSREPKLNNCLRITVGTSEENDALLNAMKEIG